MADQELRQTEEGTEDVASGDKAPKKLSFTVSKSSSSSRPVRFSKADASRGADASDVEFVSVFDGKGRGPAQAPVKVIPLPQNSWRPEKRMKNIMVASENLPVTADRFEMETLSAGPQPSVQYGLQLKRKPLNSAESGPESAVDYDLQRYREDVAELPEESSVGDYENIPVEDFAKAVMRGMGWEEGKPIGRNSSKVAQPVVAVRRDGRQGLGAIPAPKPEKAKKFIKPGESRKSKLSVGRIMCIIAGNKAGYRGQIAEVKEDYYTVVVLDSGKRLNLKEGELAEVGSPEEEKAMKTLATLRINDDNHPDEIRRGSSSEGRRKHGTAADKGQDREISPDVRDGSDKQKGATDERRKSKHNRFQTREDLDHGKESRHMSRKESRHKTNSSEREFGDGRNETSFQKYNSRKYDGHDEKNHESTSRRHNQHDFEVKSLRHKTRENQNTLESGYGKNSSTESRGEPTDLRVRRKEMNLEEGEMDAVHEEDSFGQSRRRTQSWLARDIRVRIIDKKAYGDRFYLQKACIIDVVSPLLCDIRVDEGGKIIQRVKQEHLETALPKRGGRVLVVGGMYRGQIGRLQERDSEEGIGLVQMKDDYEVTSFDLDYLAEFVGELHEMEE